MHRILEPLTTPRLVLRPFVANDAMDVQRLAGDRLVADTTANIPHPYPDGAAQAWIARHAGSASAGTEYVYAITDREGGALLGAMGLVAAPAWARAELGYWITRPRWGEGLATEAARALLEWGFATQMFERIDATYLLRNPASARVMEKLGMRFEGVHRRFYRRDGRFEDVGRYAILREEFGRVPKPATESAWKQAVRSQFAASLDALENAMHACPDALWSDRAGGVAFGDMAFHTLYFLDYYLSHSPQGFAAPAPFGDEEMDPAGRLAPSVYPREEQFAYLARSRRKASLRITSLDDARAAEPSTFLRGELSELELLLYNMRHVQHHAAQLQVRLREAGVEPPRWVRHSSALAPGQTAS